MNNTNWDNEPVHRQRWMIVDDNKNILTLMQDLVSKFTGVDLQCFHSPHAALAAFTTAPRAFDLVITDLEMPEMSGIELGSQLWKISPDIKVLLSTGSEILTTSEARQKGFCGMLRKPFPLASLRSTLEKIGVLPTTENQSAPAFQRLTAA